MQQSQLDQPVPAFVNRSTRGRTWLQTLRKNRTLLTMAAPAMLLVLVFSYLPMFGLIIAFKKYRFADGIWGSQWVGLDNFRYLFLTPAAVRVTINTLALNTMFIGVGLIVSLGLALLLNEVRNPFLSRYYQSVMFFPYLISWVIVGYFGFALLNADTGLLNQILVMVGQEPIRWYGSPEYWPLILILAKTWNGAGYGAIIYLAGIVAINPEYYEAARIDGATKWQQIRFITLPLLRPLIIIQLLLSIGFILYADFGLFYNLTRDRAELLSTTDVLDTFVFRALRTQGDIAMAAAAGFFQSIVGFILVLIVNWFVRRIDPERALF
jgi:putative aldouronate transport system permease protein